MSVSAPQKLRLPASFEEALRPKECRRKPAFSATPKRGIIIPQSDREGKAITRNNGDNTGRDAKGRFSEGNAGRPPGARHKATQAALALLDGEAVGLTRKAVDMALAGDTTALRLCLERIAPPRRDAPVTFRLPAMTTAADAAQAAGAVLGAVASGDLTPCEGAHVMALIETYRRTLETTELESRLSALEAKP